VHLVGLSIEHIRIFDVKKYFAYRRVSSILLSSSSALTSITWPRSWRTKQIFLIYKQFPDKTGNTPSKELCEALSKLCCYEKATMPSCIPLNYIHMLSDVTETQQWFLLHCSRTTDISTDVNNINIFWSSCKMSRYFCTILNSGGFYQTL
jgi:hypothetical protein